MLPPSASDVARQAMIIIGAGDHAKVVISAAESGHQRVAFVLDHDPQRNATHVFDYPVQTYTEASLPTLVNGQAPSIIAIGDNESRKKIALLLRWAVWAIVVHRTAIVDKRARIGPGTILCAGSVVNPDAVVGRHVIVNTAAVVEHDVVVGDYCHIAPNVTLCGNVAIGEGTMVGAGSVILPGRTVGAWCQIGAGAVITRDVPDGATAVGVPGSVRTPLG